MPNPRKDYRTIYDKKRKERIDSEKNNLDPHKIITINVPLRHLIFIEKLIDAGLYHSRSDMIRQAISDKIKNDLEFIKKEDAVIESDGLIKIPGVERVFRIVREA